MGNKKLIIGIPYTGCPHQSDVPVTSEPEAVAFAVGWVLGGGEAEVFMQDCGFLSSLNVITTLLMSYDILMPIHIKIISTPAHHLWSSYMAKKIIMAERDLEMDYGSKGIFSQIIAEY